MNVQRISLNYSGRHLRADRRAFAGPPRELRFGGIMCKLKSALNVWPVRRNGVGLANPRNADRRWKVCGKPLTGQLLAER